MGAGRWGSMYFHSSSDRSVGYLFLMRARVAKYPLRTTFHTASEGLFSEVRRYEVLRSSPCPGCQATQYVLVIATLVQRCDHVASKGHPRPSGSPPRRC